jgi:hypothetical protein
MGRHRKAVSQSLLPQHGRPGFSPQHPKMIEGDAHTRAVMIFSITTEDVIKNAVVGMIVFFSWYIFLAVKPRNSLRRK